MFSLFDITISVWIADEHNFYPCVLDCLVSASRVLPFVGLSKYFSSLYLYYEFCCKQESVTTFLFVCKTFNRKCNALEI